MNQQTFTETLACANLFATYLFFTLFKPPNNGALIVPIEQVRQLMFR